MNIKALGGMGELNSATFLRERVQAYINTNATKIYNNKIYNKYIE